MKFKTTWNNVIKFNNSLIPSYLYIFSGFYFDTGVEIYMLVLKLFELGSNKYSLLLY